MFLRAGGMPTRALRAPNQEGPTRARRPLGVMQPRLPDGARRDLSPSSGGDARSARYVGVLFWCRFIAVFSLKSRLICWVMVVGEALRAPPDYKNQNSTILLSTWYCTSYYY